MMSAALAPMPVPPPPGGSADRRAEPVTAAGSGELLEGLLALLSELDQIRERAEGIAFAKEPERGLHLFREFAERISAFDRRRCDSTGRTGRLPEVRREFEALTADLLGKVRRRRLWGLVAGSDFESHREEVVRALNLFHEFLFLNFEFFTTCLPDRKQARSWVESAAVFCVEVRRVLRSFQLTETP